MASSDPSYAEKQRRYWEIYDDVRRYVDVEVRCNGAVCHIVPRENREVKVKRTMKLLFTRNWPLCGKVTVIPEVGLADPDRSALSICSTCARLAHHNVQKLQEATDE